MASPIYYTSCAGGHHWGHPPGRRWGVGNRIASWFGGGTPLYDGSGQPVPDSTGTIGSGTPVYLAAPPQIVVTQNAAMTPQPNPVAIVVPRS